MKKLFVILGKVSNMRFIKPKKSKSLILLFTVFICVFLAYYINFIVGIKIPYTDIFPSNNVDTLLKFFSIKVIYTNLFYIPIILAAIWYRKKVVYLAIFLGLVHIYITYFSLGFLVIGTLERVAVLIIIAYVIALISEKRIIEEEKLKKSEEKLKDAYDKLKETQNQLIQNEKMAALGQLASGIAHEIRNPLGIISMGIEFLNSTLPEKDEMSKKSIEKIKQAVNRANKIVTDTLQFSRTSELKFEPVNVCKLLDETISLVGHSANLNNAKINRDYPEQSIKVEGDKNLLQQVFFNLFTNAIDAMPKGGEIKIRVYSEVATQIENEIGYRTNDYFKIGDEVNIIEIEDTGEGIPKDVLLKIFDPFFTTKEPGKGTGLGLSMVHLIIDRHRGTIDVKSKVGKGTKFIVKLRSAKNQINEVSYDKKKDTPN